jgi:hypothetical protein
MNLHLGIVHDQKEPFFQPCLQIVSCTVTEVVLLWIPFLAAAQARAPAVVVLAPAQEALELAQEERAPALELELELARG